MPPSFISGSSEASNHPSLMLSLSPEVFSSSHSIQLSCNTELNREFLLSVIYSGYHPPISSLEQIKEKLAVMKHSSLIVSLCILHTNPSKRLDRYLTLIIKIKKAELPTVWLTNHQKTIIENMKEICLFSLVAKLSYNLCQSHAVRSFDGFLCATS